LVTFFTIKVFAAMVFVDTWVDGGPCGQVHVSGWVDYGNRTYSLSIHGSEPCFESGNFSGNFMTTPEPVGTWDELNHESEVRYSGNLTETTMVAVYNEVVVP
jgi:hypothetical protein